MGMTKQQENAVNHRGTTLLVSAGAGSGKTTTLSNRIIGRISDPDDPVEIDDFLIVTFTNASAADLAEKIERDVSKCVAEQPSNVKAMRQLAKIKYSNISTISSFCLGVVKKHFQLLGLPAKLRICDAAEAALLRKQVIMSVIEEKYATAADGDVFFDAVELFSGDKNDERFVSLIEKIYVKIMGFPEPQEWCSKTLGFYGEIAGGGEYLNTVYGKHSLSVILDSLSRYVDGLKNALSKMNGIEEMAAYCGYFSVDLANAERARASLVDGCGYSAAIEILSSVTKTRLSKKPAYNEEFVAYIKSLREKPYEKFNSHRKLFFSADIGKIRDAAYDCHRILEEIFDIVRLVDDRYSAEKRERGIIDFPDAERFTYKLFIEKTDHDSGTFVVSEIAKKYRDQFSEIYIDEYQDINPIQDMIFRAICTYDEEGHELNRFMVGDIKQSIYRFRGARPELFASYLERFEMLSSGGGACEQKEYLSNNFRCSESVVDFTNLVFSEIMSECYGEEDKLVFTRNEEFKVEAPCEVIVFDGNDSEEIDYYDDEIKATAAKILDIVGNAKVTGADGKPYSFGDVAVLLPKVKGVADKYAKYFENCGIPTYSEITENFFENAEIVLCMCLLNTIDNPLRDIYVTGAMRSEIFGFTDDDLLSVRRLNSNVTNTDKSMWSSVIDIASAEIEDKQLVEKCKKFVSAVESLKKYSIGTASDKLLLKMYSEFHLMNVVSEKSFNRYTENAGIRRENLMILYNLARNFEKTSFRGLSVFLEFLNDRAENPSDIRSAVASDASGAVRIMGVHHSKGLEFPVCFLCGLSSVFNKSDEQSSCIISDRMGIAFRLADLPSVRSSDSSTSMVRYDTPFRGVVRHGEMLQMLDEQKRLLYVAMTRAKDRLVMMLKKQDEAKLAEYYETGIGGEHSYIYRAVGFFDWIYPCIAKYDVCSVLFEENGIARERVFHDDKECFSVSVVTARNMYVGREEHGAESIDVDKVKLMSELIRKKLSFRYPYDILTKIRSKISVSDIKNGRLTVERPAEENIGALSVPAFLTDAKPTAAERGTAMHAFMQFASFPLCEESVEKEAKRLTAGGYISGEQFEMLDFNRLSAFFKSDLYFRIRNAHRVMREAAFTLNLPVSELYSDIGEGGYDEFLLVQGKIDCFFESDNGSYTVVDFKTDKVSRIDELSERYSLQLHYYRRAVCEMTGTDNVHMVIYSFALGESIEL